jgi:hypothetical protein
MTKQILLITVLFLSSLGVRAHEAPVQYDVPGKATVSLIRSALKEFAQHRELFGNGFTDEEAKLHSKADLDESTSNEVQMSLSGSEDSIRALKHLIRPIKRNSDFYLEFKVLEKDSAGHRIEFGVSAVAHSKTTRDVNFAQATCKILNLLPDGTKPPLVNLQCKLENGSAPEGWGESFEFEFTQDQNGQITPIKFERLGWG